MIIDFHAHAFPDSIAERAVSSLEANTDDIMRAHTDGRASSLIESMDEANVSKAILCPIATKPTQLDGILQWCASLDSERFIPLASVHPEMENFSQCMDKIVAQGIIGIKIHPMYQNFKLDDSKLDNLLSAATKTGLFVQSHCGYDVAFGKDDNADAERIARMLDKHPDMKFVATHCGAWKQWPNAIKLLAGRENIYIETSASLAYMQTGQAEEVFNAFGTDRVMFGTDSPWFNHTQEVQRINGLNLTDQQKSDILGNNAVRFLQEYNVF